MFYLFCKKLHVAISSLNKALFKQISVMVDASELGKAGCILLLEKWAILGWWDKETHKTSYYFVSKLLLYAYEINVQQHVAIRRALLALVPNIVLPQITKISNVKQL